MYFIDIYYMNNIISTELQISILFSLIGAIWQSYMLKQGLKEDKKTKNVGGWTDIISRYVYDKNGYLGIIHFSFADFFITLLLLIYSSILLLKFCGFFIIKKNKFNTFNYLKKDIFFIILFCVVMRLSFLRYN